MDIVNRFFGGGMARFFGLIVGFLLVLLCGFVSPGAFAGVHSADQSGALQACQTAGQGVVASWGGGASYSCEYSAYGPVPAPSSECASLTSAGKYDLYGSNVNLSHSYVDSFSWCVPAECVAGPVGGSTESHDFEGFWANPDGSGGQTCDNGCLVRFNYSVVAKADGSGGHSAWSTGYWVYTGARCVGSTGTTGEPVDAKPMTPDDKPPPPKCDAGQISCYIPGRGACYGTESGEQVCTGLDPDNAPKSGCATGATGTVCAGAPGGSPPPPPPDPPIAKGTSPGDSSTVTTTTPDSGGSGSSTTTQTVNSYSGTSPGPSDSGSNDGSSPGGNGSNTNGSGNSGPGSGGNGTDGKCSDGSVPTASGCSGTYRDNGCDTPPACFGDAVLCGIAANTHKAACNPAGGSSVGTASGALAAAGVPADGGASSDPSPSGLVSSSDIGSDGFDTSGLGFSHTCPASPSFEVLGHSYTLDLTPFCNFASLFGWFVLLVAYLVGLRIVATGKA